MKLSVVIPCLNGEKTIKIQLDAIASQEWHEPWEVIVSDNGSTDNSAEIVKSYKDRIPHLKVVNSGELKDRAYACNVGVGVSSGEAIVFCDVDDEIAPNWISEMGEALSTNPFVACQHETRKLNPKWTHKVWNPSLDGPRIKHNFLPVAAGCRIGFQRKVFDAVNGFTVPGLRVEDFDFCWKAQLNGYKLVFVPNAVVHYRFRNTIKEIYKQSYLDGVSEVLLFNRFSSLGMRQKSRKQAFSNIYVLIKNIFKIRDRGSFCKFLVNLGELVGHITGSLKYRNFVI
jgi:glycosyltransferase involved in cell wall biosynthesis